MTIEQKTMSQWHSDVIKYYPKWCNNKDFEDFEKFTYFSNHEDVNVDKLSVELNDYPFPDLKTIYFVLSVRVFCLGYTGTCFSITSGNVR